MGLQELHLNVPRGEVVNEARLQAGTLLQINTGRFLNNLEAATLSGGHIKLQAGYIKNDQGELFANGDMTLAGQDGGVAAEVINMTGYQVARIEAMGDITIRAEVLENRGKISYDVNKYKIVGSRRVGSTGQGE
jgi:filamentous hemagglutinin